MTPENPSDRDDPAGAERDELITIQEACSFCSPETLDRVLEFHNHRVADDGSIYWVKNELQDILDLIARMKGCTR